MPSLDASRYPHLLSPLELGACRLRNRVVHASITTRLSRDRRVTPELLHYYGARARGGAAMIVTEPLSAAQFQNLAHKVRVWDAPAVEGLSRWAAVVESEDCRLLGQIQDAGRGRHERGRNPNALGASTEPDDLSWTVPHVMSVDDIERMIVDFATSSRRLQVCGFSGVELSACHGHLFHQFLSPWMNTRQDAFGGDIDGRLRLLRQLVAAIRAECGPGFLIGVKMPGDDGLPGSIDPGHAAQLAAHLAATGGVDYFCFAQGAHASTLDLHLPDLHGPRAPYVALTRRLRAAVPGIAVMALGLITDPAEADAIVAQGSAELIGLGRPLITDPGWALKASQGREAGIRYCVSCNTCWGSIVEHQAVACDNNPRVGRAEELDYWPERASKRRRIVIVGAGVAGMEAAWIAAARGHEVTVFGSSPETGGKTRLLANLPGGEALSSIYDYQLLAAKRAGARLELGLRAGAADVLGQSPDAIVLATGASMGWPREFPLAWQEAGMLPDLRACMMDLRSVTQRQSGTAVLYDRDATEGTYAGAQRLRALYDRVVVLTPRDRIAEDVPLVTRLGILRRFAQLGIEVITLVEPDASTQWEEGILVYRNVYSGALRRIDDVALFTYASPRIASTELIDRLQPHVSVLHVIGDAYAPRTTLAATAQGHEVGHLV